MNEVVPTLPFVQEALRWADGVYRRRRLRTFLAVGLALLVVALLAEAVFSGVQTWILVVAVILALPVVGGAAWVLARLIPVSLESRVWLADRAFDLNDRLVTALDPATGVERFGAVITRELRGRLRVLEKGETPVRPERRSPRSLSRRIRRWRFQLLALLFLALILIGHGLFFPAIPARSAPDSTGPEGRPAAQADAVKIELALDKGKGARYPQGAPIGCTLAITSGAGPVTDLKLRHLDPDGRLLAVDRLPFTLEGGPPVLSFDLQPLLRRAELDGPGRRIVEVQGTSPSGKPVLSNPVGILIKESGGQGGGSSGGGGQNSPKPRPKPEPKPKPRPEGSKEETRTPDEPPPTGPPKSTPMKQTPRYVMPLIDEKGRTVEKKRWTLRFLPDSDTRDGEPEGDPKPSSFKDRVEQYRRRSEKTMDRRGVPPAERELFLRYLEALARRYGKLETREVK